jgi:hypothetical protein
MAEVLVEFSDVIAANDGAAYTAKACGGEAPGGMWHGWIEFTPVAGGPVLRTGRETTQPNRQDTIYWATGLTAVYLEGALERALTPRVPPGPARPAVPAYDGPAPAVGHAPTSNGVLNPFSVLQKGEVVLRRQLAALSSWHLVNIAASYELTDMSADELGQLSQAALIEVIVAGVKLTREPAAAPENP